MEINWEAVGAIAETLGALGVISTLIYLAVQIKTNTYTLRLTAAQQVLGLSASNATLLATDAEMNELSVTLLSTDELTPQQQAKFDALLHSVFAAHWQVHYQFTLGFLDRGIFDAYERRTVYIMSATRSKLWWQNYRFRFSESYQEYIDGLVSADA
jgi:hypothetical protein